MQKAVDDQGISMQDIDRMTSERERLQRSIESASQRLEDVKKKVAEREMEASQRLDELERLVEKYNTVAYQIGLIPATAVNAKGKNFELQVTVNEGTPNFASSMQGVLGPNGQPLGGVENERLLADSTTGYQAAHILNLDLRGQVKNSFLALRKEVSERRKVAMDVMMEDHDLLDRAKEAIEDKRNEVEALEHRVRAAEEEYEKTKEVMHDCVSYTLGMSFVNDEARSRMPKKWPQTPRSRRWRKSSPRCGHNSLSPCSLWSRGR